MSVEEFYLGPHRVRILHESESFGLAEGRFAPGVAGPAPHRHAWDEGFYVVSGRISVDIEGETHVLQAGDFGMARGGQLHTFRVDGDEPALFVATFGRNGIEYLRRMADVFMSDDGDQEMLAALHDRFGVTTE